MNLANGVQKASYRESLSHPTPITPGEVYRYTIHVWPTSNLFKTGHSVRLEISSSGFLQFAPDPDTGEPFGTTTRRVTATRTILHDPAHPSAPILSVVSAGEEGRDAPPTR